MERPPPSITIERRQKGNALFFILIAVALFAAVSYAVTHSSRGSGDIAQETAELDAALAEQCVGYVEHGVNKLKLFHDCSATDISYELPDGTNENPLNTSDTNCFVFHEDGAGLAACGPWLNEGCPEPVLAALEVGEIGCGSLVYAGESGGNRIYTTLANAGQARWAAGTTTPTGNTSMSDGLANTDDLVTVVGGDEPYDAALLCRGLGPEWYLPARDELQLLYDSRNTGALDGTFGLAWYWSSTEKASASAWDIRFSDGLIDASNKTISQRVRCVRR